MSAILLYQLFGLSARREPGEQKQIVRLLGGNNQKHIPNNNTPFSALQAFFKEHIKMK